MTKSRCPKQRKNITQHHHRTAMTCFPQPLHFTSIRHVPALPAARTLLTASLAVLAAIAVLAAPARAQIEEVPRPEAPSSELRRIAYDTFLNLYADRQQRPLTPQRALQYADLARDIILYEKQHGAAWAWLRQLGDLGLVITAAAVREGSEEVLSLEVTTHEARNEPWREIDRMSASSPARAAAGAGRSAHRSGSTW